MDARVVWPTADPEMSSAVVLVRDRDRIYGNCLPKSPQPASEVRGGHLHAFEALRSEVNNMKRTFGFVHRALSTGLPV